MKFADKRQRVRGPAPMAVASAIRFGPGGRIPWTPAALPPGVVLASDTSPAKWVEESTAARPRGLGQLMPDGFEAYARVLHPAIDADHDPVRWSTVATWTGRKVHRLMQFERIAAIPDHPNARPPWGDRPRAGEGPLLKLAEILARFTTRASDCWIAVWEGFGGIEMIEELASAPRMRTPHRGYLLFHGPLESVSLLRRVGAPLAAPNLWWPENRAWCVSTDIDLNSTYVGGSKDCIGQLMRDARLEVFEAFIEDRVDVGADHLNPEVAGDGR